MARNFHRSQRFQVLRNLKEQSEMRHSRRNKRALLLIGLPAIVMACGGSDEPSTNPIAGNYIATTFVTTGSSGQRNEIAAGSTLTITLAANGTTTGHLHVAASGSNPVLDADMAGTWTATDNHVVTFTQSADTFVRNMDFTWSTDINGISILTGDQVFSGTRIQITLSRGGSI
jgi:hypothetical protein